MGQAGKLPKFSTETIDTNPHEVVVGKMFIVKRDMCYHVMVGTDQD